MNRLFEIINESERSIKELTEAYNTHSALIKHSTLLSIKEAFTQIGWNNWDDDAFLSDGQYERLVKAYYDKKMSVVEVSADKKFGKVLSSSEYTISPNGCTCSDFSYRKLPCKHMFFYILNCNNPAVRQTEPVETIGENTTNNNVLTFVISGDFGDVSKYDIIDHIYKNGWKAASSVSKKTDYLISGDNAGAKKEKAVELNVPIISLDDFYRMLKEKPTAE